MLRFVDYDIVFREVPDEVTLALNIAGCPNRCPGCHSPYLQRTDIGEALTPEALDTLLERWKGEITCLSFMGGDADPHTLARLARHVHQSTEGRIRTAWYSGRQELPEGLDVTAFNYVKVGPYRAADGPLNVPTTNQRFYRVEADGSMTDLTSRFWRQPAE